MEFETSAFGNALLYIIVGIVFASGGLATWFLVRPKRPNEEKNAPYECGEEAIGTPWGNFNMRFYIVALIFILFDVEVVFLFPWAIVFGNKDYITATDGLWGWFAIGEAFVFIGILALGLIYAWANGHLDWVKPEEKPTSFNGKVPLQDYMQLNKKAS